MTLAAATRVPAQAPEGVGKMIPVVDAAVSGKAAYECGRKMGAGVEEARRLMIGSLGAVTQMGGELGRQAGESLKNVGSYPGEFGFLTSNK